LFVWRDDRASPVVSDTRVERIVRRVAAQRQVSFKDGSGCVMIGCRRHASVRRRMRKAPSLQYPRTFCFLISTALDISVHPPTILRMSSLRGTISGHWRVFAALGVICVVYALLPSGVSTRTRAILAWDVGVVSFLLMTLQLFLSTDAHRMPAIAEALEDAQWTIFWVVFFVSVVSFFAVTTELAGLKELNGWQRTARVAFVAGTLILSWLLTHVVFAVRYAHEWYDSDGDGALRRGLDFPGDNQPDYMDFLYFSLVLGMTFQVSDVQITGRGPRRLALLHGLISFLYNTVIIALTVNIAAGLL
jgi:uncharacterized membrane protein